MHTPNFPLSSTTICKVKSIPISRGYTRLLWLSNENIGRGIQAYGSYSIRGGTFSFKGFNGRWWLISRVKMPRERAAGTTPHAISEYRSSRMTDNARVAEERKWEVAKERRGLRRERGGRGRRIGGKGWSGEYSGVPVHEQLALFARSFTRSLASSIIIRPLCPPAISAALSPSTMSTWHSPSRSRTLLAHPTVLSFNHKAHRRRTCSRGSSALPVDAP